MISAGIETLGIALIDVSEIDGVLKAIAGGRGQLPKILTVIHTKNDTIDKVREAEMEKGVALVERIIRRVSLS